MINISDYKDDKTGVASTTSFPNGLNQYYIIIWFGKATNDIAKTKKNHAVFFKTLNLEDFIYRVLSIST